MWSRRTVDLSSRAGSAPRFPQFCSDVSRENHESLAGTASRIDHWLLVEYRSLWGPNALRASGLSDQAKDALRQQLRAREHTRLLFIRRPDRRGREELRAYAATSLEGEEELRCHAFEEYDDLRTLEGEEELRCHAFEEYDDLRTLDLASAGEPVEQPLFLVCTHGKHDACCARYGRPLFEALAEQLEEETVWQCTHVGGDRFAGNVVCLPHGLYYGRVERGDAVGVLDEHLSGRVTLANYRGRSCYPFHVQAAEADVRGATGALGLDDLRLAAADRSRVVFEDAEGKLHEREVAVELGPEDYLTCAAVEMRRPRRYVVSEPVSQ